MADRQGLLIGRHLSPVQFKGTIILEYLAQREKATENVDSIKRSLLSSGKPIDDEQVDRLQRMFPDLFPAREMSEDEELPESGQGDYSEVEWKGPSDAASEYQELMAEIAALNQGTMTGDEVTIDASRE